MAKEREQRDQAEKQRSEELRASMKAEKDKIEVSLAAERQLGLEKDGILGRSKQREAELMDKVTELEGDLDVLDTEREQALAAAENTKQRLAKVQLDFDQLLQQASMLEKQGSDWRSREADLLKESKDRSTVHLKLEVEAQALVARVEELQRSVSQKEEALKRAKERADMNAAELEKRLQLEKGRSYDSSDQEGLILTEW